MSIMNLAHPEYWEMVDKTVERAIGAEVVDMEYVLRPTFAPDNGFDVRADFVVLWVRDTCRDVREVQSFGTHRGCIRFNSEAGEFRANLDNGHYDLSEASARQDFISRQVGLG